MAHASNLSARGDGDKRIRIILNCICVVLGQLGLQETMTSNTAGPVGELSLVLTLRAPGEGCGQAPLQVPRLGPQGTRLDLPYHRFLLVAVFLSVRNLCAA